MSQKTRTGAWSSLLKLLCVFILALPTGCGKQSPTEPGSGRLFPLISPHTYVITEGGEHSLLDRDGSTFIVRSAAGAPGIGVGHIIIGADRGGFIRRVISVREAMGALALETEPAALTDAVIVGTIDTTIHLGAGSSRLRSGASPPTIPPIGTRTRDLPVRDALTAAHGAPRAPHPNLIAPGATLSDEGLVLSGVSLLESGTGDRRSTIVMTDGFVTFDPAVETGFTIRARSIDRLFARAEGLLRFRCDLSIDIPESIEAAGEIPLASFSANFVRYIGAVPVAGVVTLHFTAGYEVSGAYVGGCDVSFDAEAYTSVTSSRIETEQCVATGHSSTHNPGGMAMAATGIHRWHQYRGFEQILGCLSMILFAGRRGLPIIGGLFPLSWSISG